MDEQIKDNNLNNELKSDRKKITWTILGVAIFVLLVVGTTYAYFAFSVSNNNITGKTGTANLTLTVTKVLPTTSGTNNITINEYSNLPTSLNNKCTENTYTSCQLYKVTLRNNSSSISVKVDGSVQFFNETVPNLSYITLSTYSSATTYTTSNFPTEFVGTTPTYSGSTYTGSTFTKFTEGYILNTGASHDFYLLVWVNNNVNLQTDNGTYTGTIKFEDANGNGITSTFTP